MKYRGSVISDAGNGVEFVGEHGTWYAHTSGGDHFVPFDLSFRWPKRFTLIATGKEVESSEDSEMKSGRWKSEVPFAVAGFNLGEYKMETAAGDHPKIGFMPINSSKTSSWPCCTKVPPSTRPSCRRLFKHRMTQQELVLPLEPPPPSPASVLKHLGGEVSDSIHFLENLNGPFPFDHLDVSQIPGSFGQGWPGLLYFSTLVFLAAR